MPASRRIAQVALPVKDLARATAFYRDVVQLPLLFQVPNLSFFDCAGTRLMLGAAEGDADRGASIVYYLVDDVRAEHAAITGRGAAAVHGPQMIAQVGGNDIWMAFYTDSEGNTFALTSEHPTEHSATPGSAA